MNLYPHLVILFPEKSIQKVASGLSKNKNNVATAVALFQLHCSNKLFAVVHYYGNIINTLVYKFACRAYTATMSSP